MYLRYRYMKRLVKENARLGMWVSVRGEVGRIDAMTQSIVALLLDDGKYMLAKWGEIDEA